MYEKTESLAVGRTALAAVLLLAALCIASVLRRQGGGGGGARGGEAAALEAEARQPMMRPNSLDEP